MQGNGREKARSRVWRSRRVTGRRRSPERRVTGERVRLLAAQGGHESVAAALFAAAAVLVLWPVVEHGLLLAWFALTTLPAVARTLVARAYRRTSVDIRDSGHPRWALRFGACSAASGVVWGGVALLLPASAASELGVLLLLHAGYVALISGLLAVWLPAAVGFVVPSTLVVLAHTLFRGDAALLLQASLLVALAAGSIVCAHRGSRSLLDAVRARFEREEESVRLAAERDRAELAVQAKCRFLAAASHDLRQPVHALGLLAGVLRARLGDEAAGGAVGKVRESIDALSAMFDRVLDLSRSDADAAEDAPRAVPLAALLRRVELTHEMPARAKGLSLSIEAPDDLSVRVDPTALERVLTNLVGNAIKFTERGGVVVSARLRGERVSLSVRDTGRGIPAAERERVFSEYHQVRRDDRHRGGGRGLGLAIVRRLCGQMNASIELVSVLGEGSEFRLSVPRAARATRTARGTRAADDARRRYAAGGRRRRGRASESRGRRPGAGARW